MSTETQQTQSIQQPAWIEIPPKREPNLAAWKAGDFPNLWAEAAATLNVNDNAINQATACFNHPPNIMAKDALIWVAADGTEERWTFLDLQHEANRVSNALKELGIQPGERVFVFMERVPQLFASLLGILQFGAIAGPLFAAFGPEAVLDRLQDSEAVALITTDNLYPPIAELRDQLPALQHIIALQRNQSQPLPEGLHRYQDVIGNASNNFTPTATTADDGSIMHYTSGTTGKPKGALHKHGALLSQWATAKYVLDLKPDDIYWCTADPGWVTGTAYGMIGPWSQGVTQLVYEGGFCAKTWYQLIEKYQVSVWYTAPTAIRMLMKAGDDVPGQFNLNSLRHLASVGEPLNPEAIHWGVRVLGMPFHDTWWQTETGSMHIVNLPGQAIQPGSMGQPIPGVEAGILDEQWQPLPDGEEGHLAIRPVAPSIFKTYWKREAVYESKFQNGWYLTGDRAKRDEHSYYWFIGRDDDVINTAGHLVGPFEVESALVAHPAVAEAAVIGKPDNERLEIIKAFISLNDGLDETAELLKDIQLFVRKHLAAHAYPREIAVLPSLPKTRSGKIMRRLLKARELGLPEGDTSTLED